MGALASREGGAHALRLGVICGFAADLSPPPAQARPPLRSPGRSAAARALVSSCGVLVRQSVPLHGLDGELLFMSGVVHALEPSRVVSSDGRGAPGASAEVSDDHMATLLTDLVLPRPKREAPVSNRRAHSVPRVRARW